MAGQLWVTNSLGGFMSSKNLSKVLRKAVQPLCKYRQFCDAKEAVGLHKGQIFTWNVYSDLAQAGTTLVETSTMPKTNFTITQGTMTMLEYGNSVDYSGILDNLSEQPVKEIIKNALQDDAFKAFDAAAHAKFNATLLYVSPAGGTSGTSSTAVALTTNGTTTTMNNVAFGKSHAGAISDVMRERNIPAYIADDYMAIAHPTTFRQLKTDLEAVHQYTSDGFQLIINGEIGRYENFRFVQQTNIAKETFANAKSNFIYFFGADSVAEGVAVPEEVRGAIPSDYGRSMGVAWYAVEGFALTHAAAPNARVVKWASAG